MADYVKNFQKNLSLFLKQNQMTQNDFAILCGCDKATVSKWLKGKREPSFNYICIIIRVLDCTFEELIS